MSIQECAAAVRACEAKLTANHQLQDGAREEPRVATARCRMLYEEQDSLEHELRELQHALELAVRQAASQAVERVGEGEF